MSFTKEQAKSTSILSIASSLGIELKKYQAIFMNGLNMTHLKSMKTQTLFLGFLNQFMVMLLL